MNELWLSVVACHLTLTQVVLPVSLDKILPNFLLETLVKKVNIDRTLFLFLIRCCGHGNVESWLD